MGKILEELVEIPLNQLWPKQTSCINIKNCMIVSQTNLQDILEGTKQYVVPLFQRPYSWEKEQWETLWQDISDLYQHEHPSPHFMGSIVTMQTEFGPEKSVTKFLLIDGQQRLTTVFIIL